MEISQPCSIIEIEVEKLGKKMCFKRLFVALRPCIDGFIAGCRPYIGLQEVMKTVQRLLYWMPITTLEGTQLI